MNIKKWVKSIQTRGYNGARTVVGQTYNWFSKNLASLCWACNVIHTYRLAICCGDPAPTLVAIAKHQLSGGGVPAVFAFRISNLSQSYFTLHLH